MCLRVLYGPQNKQKLFLFFCINRLVFITELESVYELSPIHNTDTLRLERVKSYFVTSELLQNKPQTNETQCTTWYSTFNYVTQAHDLIRKSFLLAIFPSTSTRCCELMIPTLQLPLYIYLIFVVGF